MRIKTTKDKKWHNVVTLYDTMVNGHPMKGALLEDGRRLIQPEWIEEDPSDQFQTKDNTDK